MARRDQQFELSQRLEKHLIKASIQIPDSILQEIM